MADEPRKSYSVWLKPRHVSMLDSMPDVKLSDLVRKSIEDLFEGKNDREYAKLHIEEDIDDVMERWHRVLGLDSDATVTSMEDGFRVVIVALKQYNTSKVIVRERSPVSEKIEEISKPSGEEASNNSGINLDDEFDDYVDEN